uniref:Uncharacterized protein n=1 Tax=viral metagenome TaxID=1070528 RepID=A0A6M3K6W7_9ZZZZ
MFTMRVFRTVLVAILALALGHVVETTIKCKPLAGGLAAVRFGRLALQVNVYRPGRAFVRLAAV